MAVMTRGSNIWIRLIATLFLFALGFEWCLAQFSPVTDPLKDSKQFNSYIRGGFRPNLQVTFKVNLSGHSYSPVYQTNNLGFRGAFLAMPKPENEYRIFLVGASTTEGLYLNENDALHHVLETNLNSKLTDHRKIRVYNAGKSGHHSDDHISVIAHRIVHLQPDMIILSTGLNDLIAAMGDYDYLHFRSDPLDTFTALKGVKMLAMEFQIPRRIFWAMKKVRTHSNQEVMEGIPLESDFEKKAAICNAIPVAEGDPKVDLEPYRSNLETIIGTAQSHHIRLILVTVPDSWSSGDPFLEKRHWQLCLTGQRYSEDRMHRASERYNDVMREVANKFHIPLYDLALSMPKSSKYYYDDCHFTVEGTKKIVEGLAPVVTQQISLVEDVMREQKP